MCGTVMEWLWIGYWAISFLRGSWHQRLIGSYFLLFHVPSLSLSLSISLSLSLSLTHTHTCTHAHTHTHTQHTHTHTHTLSLYSFASFSSHHFCDSVSCLFFTYCRSDLPASLSQFLTLFTSLCSLSVLFFIYFSLLSHSWSLSLSLFLTHTHTPR